MRQKLYVALAVGLAVIWAIGCCKGTSGSKDSQTAQTSRREADVNMFGPTPPALSGQLPSGKWSRLVNGDYDKAIGAPSEISNQRDLQALLEQLSADEKSVSEELANYDRAKVLASRPSCETAIETFLKVTVNGRNFERRFDSELSDAIREPWLYERWHRTFTSPSEANAKDLRFVLMVFGDFAGHTMTSDSGKAVQMVSATFNNLRDKEPCYAKYRVIVGDWWVRYRAGLEEKKQIADTRKTRLAEMPSRCAESLAAPAECDRIPGLSPREKDDCYDKCMTAAQQAVLVACPETFGAASAKCDQIHGLGDTSRVQCRNKCSELAVERLRSVLADAQSDCKYEDVVTTALKKCDLARPAGTPISDSDWKKGVATCRSQCATERQAIAVRRARERAEELRDAARQRARDACEATCPARCAREMVWRDRCISQCEYDCP